MESVGRPKAIAGRLPDEQGEGRLAVPAIGRAEKRRKGLILIYGYQLSIARAHPLGQKLAPVAMSCARNGSFCAAAGVDTSAGPGKMAAKISLRSEFFPPARNDSTPELLIKVSLI